MPMNPAVIPPFSVTAASREGVARLAVSGELDVATAPELASALSAAMAHETPVLLDLSGVTFMDSSGIAVLLAAIKAAQANGWDLGVTPGLSAPVKATLQLTGLLPLLPVLELPPDYFLG